MEIIHYWVKTLSQTQPHRIYTGDVPHIIKIHSSDDYDEQRYINGRKSGDNPSNCISYFSYIDYARETNDPSWFKDEMECNMIGNKSRLEVYKESIRYDGKSRTSRFTNWL